MNSYSLDHLTTDLPQPMRDMINSAAKPPKLVGDFPALAYGDLAYNAALLAATKYRHAMAHNDDQGMAQHSANYKQSREVYNNTTVNLYPHSEAKQIQMIRPWVNDTDPLHPGEGGKGEEDTSDHSVDYPSFIVRHCKAYDTHEIAVLVDDMLTAVKDMPTTRGAGIIFHFPGQKAATDCVIVSARPFADWLKLHRNEASRFTITLIPTETKTSVIENRDGTTREHTSITHPGGLLVNVDNGRYQASFYNQLVTGGIRLAGNLVHLYTDRHDAPTAARAAWDKEDRASTHSSDEPPANIIRYIVTNGYVWLGAAAMQMIVKGQRKGDALELPAVGRVPVESLRRGLKYTKGTGLFALPLVEGEPAYIYKSIGGKYSPQFEQAPFVH